MDKTIYFTFILFIIHLIFNLEKYIFFTEILVFTSIFLFIYNLKIYMQLKQDKLILIILFLIIYGFIYSIFSFIFLRDGTIYQFGRTLPVWYSIFTFFLGIEFYNKIIRRNKNNFLNKYSYFIAVLDIIIGGRLSNFSLIPLLFYKHVNFLFLTFIFIMIMAIYKGGSTSYMIFLSMIAFFIFRKKSFLQTIIFNKIFIYSFLILIFYILYYVYNTYSDFFIIGFSAFGEGSDNNLLWRLMFWSYEFSENIINHPLFGIGFGTKLFDINSDSVSFLISANPEDINYEYTLGTHNSFILILIRLGAFGFLPILGIYFLIFYRYKKYNFYRNKEVTSLFLAFIFISISALFNVILESPLYSGIYWIILGMLYQSMKYYSKKEVAI